jgi:hypothetical protein
MPGVKADLVDRDQTRLTEGLIQRPHLGRDVAGGAEVRAFVQAQRRDGDMLVGGQHRHGNIARLQRVAQGLKAVGADVVGQVANLGPRFLDRAVPDGDRVAGFDQAAKAGDGRKAGAAPVDGHGFSPFGQGAQKS